MQATHPADRASRLEGVVLVLILLVVAGFAGAASFTHVKDWTLANSPPGTGEWFGWANAVISELVPIAALLTIRRRRRCGGPIGYPMFLLIAAASLSLSAQLVNWRIWCAEGHLLKPLRAGIFPTSARFPGIV